MTRSNPVSTAVHGPQRVRELTYVLKTHTF